MTGVKDPAADRVKGATVIGPNAERFAGAARAHWQIENDLHWSLVVAFREDDSRLPDRRACENCAALRHMTLSR